MVFVKNKKEMAVCIGFVLAILVIRLWNIADLDVPIVFDDEVGYWSHAANLAGLSWTETEPAWYSYGYSLLLVPLFWITHNMSYLYRMAIVINAIMGIFCFVFAKYIVQEVDERCGNMTAMMISFTSVSYSAYIFQANVAWSESFIYMWFLFVVWTMHRYCKFPTWKYTILLSSEVGFLYIIHNRCIAILAAYLLTLFFMVIKKKMDGKKLAAVIFVLGIIFFANSMIKVHISQLMWEVSDGFSGNDMLSQGSKIKMLFHLEGWRTLLQSAAGKVWYILSSTLMLAYAGMVFIIKNMISYLRKEEKDANNSVVFFYIFILFSVCGSIALTSIAATTDGISKIGNVRLDIFFYGRYSEVISGILILLGFVHYLSVSDARKRNIFEPVIGLAVYLFCSVVLYNQIADIDKFIINTTCAPGIYFFKDFSVIKIVLLVAGVYVAMNVVLILMSTFHTDKKTLVKIIYCCIITILFINVSKCSYQCCIKVNQDIHSSSSDLCKVLNENSNYPVYNIVKNNFYKQGIRTRAVESKIKYELPINLTENCFIVVEGERIKKFAEDLYYITAVRDICLLGVGDQLAKDLQKKGVACELLEQAEYSSYNMRDVELKIEKGVQDIELAQKEDLSVNVIIQSKKSGVILNNDKSYKLSYHIYKEGGEEILKDGKRYDFGTFVNQEVLQANIESDEFKGTGNYIVEFDLVEEGVAWMSDLKGKTAKINVSVVDDSIRYTYDIETENFIKSGFHPKENGFAWTSSEIAEIRCYLDKQDYNVRLQQSVGIPLEELNIDSYSIEVFLNNDYLTTMTVNRENNGKELCFKISEEQIRQGKNMITFKSQMWSPKEYGAKDERKLGFAFHKMIFENEQFLSEEGKLDAEKDDKK